MLPTPKEIVAYLDESVFGQKQAKRDLAVSVYNHYLGLATAEVGDPFRGEDQGFGKQHVLLMGPTGAGKTFLIRKLAERLGVPVAFCTATSYVQAGYKGQLVEGMVDLLLAASGNDLAKAQRGIIFIDEVDKIHSSNLGGGIDVSGTGVQNSLLTLLDGRHVKGLDTGKLLFIAAGAFVDLVEIVRNRMQRIDRTIGFRPPAIDDIPSDFNDVLKSEFAALCNVEHQDLVAFGYIPEFIGRFAVLSAVREVSRSELVAIMTDSKDSIIAKQIQLFQLHGVKLEFEPEALGAIADEAEQLRTGARALTRMVLKSLDHIDWQLPELAAAGVKRVLVTAETIRLDHPPIITTVEQEHLELDSSGIFWPPAGSPEFAISEELRKLRAMAIPEQAARQADDEVKDPVAVLPVGVTDVRGMSEEQIIDLLLVTEAKVGWPQTEDPARKWWLAFKRQQKTRPALVLRLCEELQRRNATITEFFLCYVGSDCDNLQANLHFLDYCRLKKKEKERKQRQPDSTPSTNLDGGSDGSSDGSMGRMSTGVDDDDDDDDVEFVLVGS